MKSFKSAAIVMALTYVCAHVTGAGATNVMYQGDELNHTDTLTDGDYTLTLDVRCWTSCDGEQTPVNSLYVRLVNTAYNIEAWSSPADTYYSSGYGNHHDQWRAVQTAGHLVMQGDGNLVLYQQAYNFPGWATQTNGNPGAFFQVQYDGNIVVYNAWNSPLWSKW